MPAAGARQVGAELAALISEGPDGNDPVMDHDCQDCVLGQTATLPLAAQIDAPAVFVRAAEVAPRFETRFWASPRGPPLGSRAPPAWMKA
jgi:hypothetical protein